MARHRLLAQRTPDPGTMRMHSTREGDMHVIALEGEICLESAPRVEHELTRVALTSVQTIVVDLRATTFIDSCGIRMALQAQQRAAEAGSRLLLVRGPRAVQRPFELCGLAHRLPFVDAVVMPRGA